MAYGIFDEFNPQMPGMGTSVGAPSAFSTQNEFAPFQALLMQQLAQNPALAAKFDAAGIPPPMQTLAPGMQTGTPGAMVGGGLGDLLPQPGFGMAGMPGFGAAAPAAMPALQQYGMQPVVGPTGGVPAPVTPPAVAPPAAPLTGWDATVTPAAGGAGAQAPAAAALANVAKQIAAPQKTEYPRLIPQNAPQVAKVPDRLLLDILMAGLGPAGRGGIPGGGR